MSTNLIKTYFSPHSQSSSPSTSLPLLDSSVDNNNSASSITQASTTSSLESLEPDSKDTHATMEGFETTGFTAVNSTSNTPAKRVKNSTSPSETSHTQSPGDRNKTQTFTKSKQNLLDDGIEALDMDWNLPQNVETHTDKAVKGKDSASGISWVAKNAAEAVNSTASALGKHAREALEPLKKKLGGAEKERRKSSRIQELDEKVSDDAELDEDEAPQAKKPRLTKQSLAGAGNGPFRPKADRLGYKKWESTGLYVGQEREFDPRYRAQKQSTKKSKAPYIEGTPSLPGPMFTGQRILEVGRDFKLPFDIYSPLQARQPKPEEWKKTRSNRFVGDAAAEWKKAKPLPPSRCICKPTRGCDDNCFNRAMFYECDDDNCNVGAESCGNRPFAELKQRRETGRQYDIGVEVCKTSKKGHGVRACRSFEPNQVIVEYAGEIITQEESERRMNEDYKDNECYYLMEFDQNMIIDATRGTVARFVNHSCSPNCEMVKWIVAGKPRMALFAGPNGVMTGEELTYDYNLDNFSKNNVKTCYCGAANCRGFIGRRPAKDKEQETRKSTTADLVAGVKRKFHKIIDDNPLLSGEAKAQRHRSVLQASTSANMKSTGGVRTFSGSSGTTTLVGRPESSTYSRDNDDFVIRKTATHVSTEPFEEGSHKRQKLNTGNMLQRMGSTLKRAGSKLASSNKGPDATEDQSRLGSAALKSQMTMFDFGFGPAARPSTPDRMIEEKPKVKRTPASQRWFYEVVPQSDKEVNMQEKDEKSLSKPRRLTKPKPEPASNTTSLPKSKTNRKTNPSHSIKDKKQLLKKAKPKAPSVSFPNLGNPNPNTTFIPPAPPAPKEPRPKKVRHSWFYETVPADEDLDAAKLQEKKRSTITLLDPEELAKMEEGGKRGSLRRKSSAA